MVGRKKRNKKAQLLLGKTRYSLYSILQYSPSRSSKVDDFHLIWKGVCHFFLLEIDSNLGSISHRFRDMAIFPLKNARFLPSLCNFNFENVPLH